MNNEIEQIAQQNDMSVEFVRWFFNEKKATCGEQWFLALGAMWEGWKAREGEATALALTLEKSREASGCPAGVDLQDWVKQLAAESLQWQMSIPHRILSGIKADAAAPLVNALKVIANSEQHNGDTVVCDFDTLISVASGALRDYYAKQLREGADK